MPIGHNQHTEMLWPCPSREERVGDSQSELEHQLIGNYVPRLHFQQGSRVRPAQEMIFFERMPYGPEIIMAFRGRPIF